MLRQIFDITMQFYNICQFSRNILLFSNFIKFDKIAYILSYILCIYITYR